MSKKFSMKDLLNEQSKGEVKPTAPPTEQSGATVPATSSGFVIHDIPIEKIIPSPINKYGIRDIEELAASIEEMGLMHNLTVKEPDGEGLYELVSGERRYHACKLLYENGNEAYKAVPCKIEPQGDPALTELKLLFANAMARVHTDYEKTMQAGRIKEILQEMKANGYKFKGRMRDVVADLLKVSPAQIGRMESINKHLSEGFKGEYEAGNIGISDAYNLSTKKPDEQAAVFEHYKETGELEPPKATEPPPSVEAFAGSGYAQSYDRDEDEALEDDPPQGMERVGGVDIPKRAHAYLTDKDGKEFIASGNLALIAAVDMGEDWFEGAFSTSEGVTGLDYATLAKAVCAECLSRIEGDSTSIDIMRIGLMKLFDKKRDVVTEGMKWRKVKTRI